MHDTTQKTWRTLVQIVNRKPSPTETYLAIVVPSWNTDQGMIILASNLPPEVRTDVLDGNDFFFCQVNIGAEKQSGLRFEPPFEKAPRVSEDELYAFWEEALNKEK